MNLKIIQEKIKKDNRKIWEQLKKRSIKYREDYRKKSNCNIIIDSEDYFLICPIGDEHFGGDGVDYALAEKHAKLIGSCNYAIAFDVSDTTDNFINQKIVTAIINSRTTPVDQIKLFQTWLDFFQGHYILSVSGNHQNWSFKKTGVDWLEEFMQKNKIVYNRDEIKIKITLNGIEYTGKLRHKVKNKSMYNATHGLKQNQRFFSSQVFDFIIAGHYHHPAIEQTRIFGQVCTFIQTGTYKILDSYAIECGYGEGYSDMPCFIISPFQKSIIPVYSIEQGIEIVEKLNLK